MDRTDRPLETEGFDDQTRDFEKRGGGDPATSPLPARIGRFRILALLGSGGYGHVYHAYDEGLEREVAVKVLREEVLRSPQHLHMLLDEAKNCARLDHPHIVPIYDVGQAPGLPCYLVSKFVRGETLSQRIERSRPPFDRLATIVASIGDALHYAHQRGLIHRDVKASNILIDQDEHAWLVDFGLALRDEQIGNRGSGKLVGTCAYMSPEQARGEGHLVDRRSDVFSLGVVLYEGACGVRPFRSDSLSGLVQLILAADAEPPRMRDPQVPAELERICLKALSRRAAERYPTAAEMADDLRHFADAPQDARQDAPVPGVFVPASPVDSPPPTPVVVPKGLRAFDQADRDFFFSLVPGPRDRSGMPEMIRSWKAWIESSSAETTARGGLIYGPSGCGKSSLIQAGVLPSVDAQVEPVYLECSPRDTEDRLLRAVRERCAPSASPLGLVETLAAIRQGQGLGGARKLLIVLDQFEQWLHSHSELFSSELVAALRQCDGRHLQCWIAVRDDFWMDVTRFFRELDIDLSYGRNCMAVELFDLRHARKVLAKFGRAYGCLPADGQPLEPEHLEFLNEAVAGLQQEGRVISVHLALFAEMIKSRDWTPATLLAVGGTAGVGVSFLEYHFNSSAASPVLRRLQEPARAVLRALLPDAGSDIKGQMQPATQLRRAAGLDDREFAELIGVLDKGLRLVTPMAPEGSPAEQRAEGASAQYYQLTHDFLVLPLREWLFQKQRETVRGRAEYRLAELAARWRERHDRRQLPSQVEFLTFLLLTRPETRDDDQRQFMAAATRRYAIRWAAAAVLLLVVTGISAGLLRMGGERRRQQQAESLVAQLRASRIESVPALLSEMAAERARIEPLLRAALEEAGLPVGERTRLQLGLVASDPAQVAPLEERLLTADPAEIGVIRETLRPRRDALARRLWRKAGDVQESGRERLGAAAALAAYAPADPRWETIAAQVAEELVHQNSLYLEEWMRLLEPVRQSLADPLQSIFSSDATSELDRLAAAQVLSVYAADDAPRLVALTLESDAAQFKTLAPRLAAHNPAAREMLEGELDREVLPSWDDLPAGGEAAPLPAELVRQIEAAEGLVQPSYALWHTMPEDQWAAVAEALASGGWTPKCLRPYRRGDAVYVAAIWWRGEEEAHSQIGLSADRLREIDRQQQAAGLIPIDVTAYRAPTASSGKAGWQYAALWAEPSEPVVDGQMYVEVPETQHAAAWGPLNDAGFVARTNCLTGQPGGERFFTSVRWKLQPSPVYTDLWHGSEAQHGAHDFPGWCQVDVRLNPPASPNPDQPCGGVWWNGIPRQSQRLERAPVAEHLRRCLQISGRVARPVALSVAIDAQTDSPLATSVWHTPLVANATLDRLASRQANALLALARLGHFDALWPYLRAEDARRIRTFLIHRLADYGVSPTPLVERLAREGDESSKIALLLALSQYSDRALSREVRSLARRQIAQSLEEPLPVGCRSAIAHLLDRWPWLELSLDGAASVAQATAPDRAGRWYVTREGQTMAIVEGPVEFAMGSPGGEAERDHAGEVMHPRRIPRRFALATHELTVRQYHRFTAASDHLRAYGPSDDCPVNMISWYDAAKYCRWLSEQEGIPEAEMCYPPIDEIGEGMSLPPDLLSRTGYRLPTEAEWEYAARAGSPLPRFYGYAPQLVRHYAWNVDNSEYRSWPVGSLMPNDYGLFDIYGNNMEWCHDADRPYPRDITSVHVDQLDEDHVVSNGSRRILRGGSFLYILTNARSAQRHHEFPQAVHPYTTVRIARTLP